MEDDFAGEFAPIQRLLEEEAKNDRLVKLINLQRKERKKEEDEKEAKRAELELLLQRESEQKPTEVGQIDLTESVSDNGAVKRSISMPFSIKKIKLFNSAAAKPQPVVVLPEPITAVPSPALESRKPPNANLGKALLFLDKLKAKKTLHEVQDTVSGTSVGAAEAEVVISKVADLFSHATAQEPPNNHIITTDIHSNVHSTTNIGDLIARYPDFESFFRKNPVSPTLADILAVKKCIVSQLTGKVMNFPNLFQSTLLEKYQEVYRMFEHTIKDHEGHSALLIGPRYLGKTAIIQRALDELEKIYADEFIVIRLNAYHQTDENTALREIARQLDKNLKRVGGIPEDSDEFANFEQRSLSDTFSNILSILDKNDKETESDKSNTATNTRTVSIIIVIEEFEKFTQSSKQTLLYNLFDLSQNSSTPVCIVGVTTKFTTRELLEKRVRLRFSQRIITINKSRTIDEFWGNAKLGLYLGNEDIQSLQDPKYGLVWNQFVDFAYELEGLQLRKLISTNFYTTKSYKEFNNWMVYAISAINVAWPFPRPENITRFLASQPVNNIQAIVKSLSELEVLITIAAARWLEKSSMQVINFNIAYREYEDMVKQYNISTTTVSATNSGDAQILTNFKINQRIWPANIMKNCWENLYKLELLLEPQIDKATSIYNAGVVEDTRMVQLDVTLSELHLLVDDSHIGKKLTKL